MWLTLFSVGWLPGGTLAGTEAPVVLVEWNFDREAEGWVGTNHLADISVAEGALQARAVGWDPFVIGPLMEIPARPWQAIEVRLRSDVSGLAEFFWTNTTETAYGGFFPGKETGFEVIGDGAWHTYRVQPFWQAEKKIIRLRLDFPGGTVQGQFAVDFIRVIEEPPPPLARGEGAQGRFDFSGGLQGWLTTGITGLQTTAGGVAFRTEAPAALLSSPALSAEAGSYPFLTLRMAVTSGRVASVFFISDEANGRHRRDFPLKADGKFHTYNLELAADSRYRGTILALALRPSNAPQAEVQLESLSLSAEPGGPPDLEVVHFGLDRPMPRSGRPAKLLAILRNVGGERAERVHAQWETLGPNRLSPVGKGEPGREGPQDPSRTLPFGIEETFEWEVQADQPGTYEVRLKVEGANVEPLTATAFFPFTMAPQVPPSDYVPEPQPIHGDYQVGVYYFPGWSSGSNWAPLLNFRERQPLLGWYREGLPEVADWQIKWAVEHGIDFFIYDWYWNQGGRSLEHALHNGFFKARYQNLLKFCLLWANHNPPFQAKDPARKVEEAIQDLLNVTDYWIANYFHRDNYLKIEGQPVVVIFSYYRIREDLGHINVRAAFEKMRERCRQAGLAGLYLIACVGEDPNSWPILAEEGYDAVSGYNWPGLGMRPEEGSRAPFDALIPAYRQLWESIARSKSIPLIPPVSGGWDSRPWHGDGALVRYGRTPENFRRHLEDVKEFLDTHGEAVPAKMCFIEAWNEWGEGSYIEPHQEFGFGYLDAIRAVFTTAPPEHLDLIPEDVGLGPYDVPLPTYRTAWEFDTDGDGEGWGAMMQVGEVRVVGGALTVRTAGADPALSALLRAAAATHPFLAARIKASRDFSAQLFWQTTTSPISEANSVHFNVQGDGEWHEYRIHLAGNPRWRGVITGLRFDLGNEPNVEVAIDYLRLAP